MRDDCTAGASPAVQKKNRDAEPGAYGWLSVYVVGFRGSLAERFLAALKAVCLGAIATVALLLLLPVIARADTTTTINFETPVIAGSNSPQQGPALSTQYESDGVKFIDSSTSPVASPVGFVGPFSPPYLYRDTANAHSGTQVLWAHDSYGEGEQSNSQFFAQLSTETTSVSLYVGVQNGSAGNAVDLTGYDPQGNVVQSDSQTAGTQDDTLLQISSGTADIAYFSVAVIDGGSPQTPTLEADDLSFVVPSTPPPPEIVLPPGTTYGPVGSRGESSSLGFTIDRLNGANDPVDLTVSGLPSGVSVTGGTTIPANSSTTTLEFSVAPGAPLVNDASFTITATSSDVSGTQGPVMENFTVVTALSLQLDGSAGNVTVPMGPCSNTDVGVAVNVGPGVSTPTTLTVTTTGDSTGLSYALSSSSAPPTYTELNLSLARTSTAGSGDLEITITATNGNAPPVSETVIVHRTGLVAQGLYVTQGTQYDNGALGLVPSGTSQSGGNYSGVTLVAGKKTVVRLYADAGTAAGVPGAVARLYVYRNGQLQGTLQPDYGPLTASGTPETTLPGANAPASETVSDAELESNANAYTFTLPDVYTYSGTSYPAGQTISLVGQVVPPTGGAVGCQASNSFTLNNVNFSEVGANYDATVEPFPMTVNGTQPPAPQQVFTDASAVAPLPDFPGVFVEPYFGTIDITDIANSTSGPCGQSGSAAATACGNNKNAAVLGRVEGVAQSFPGHFSHVVGVNLGTARGLTNAVPGQFSVVDGTPNFRPLTSVAHELFHQFGLLHASFCNGGGGSNNQQAVSWPPDQQGFLDGIGLDTTSEPYKFIAAGSPSFPANPVAYDFMSYCANIGGNDPNDWLSPRNWQQVISNFGTGPATHLARAASAVPRTRAAGTAPRTAVAEDSLAARASVDSARLSVLGFVTSTGVNITSVGPQVGTASPRGNSADSFTLTALGGHGQTLASVPMAATTGGHIDGVTAEPLVQISGEVPARGVASIKVADNGTVVVRRRRPAKAPRVSIFAPRAGAHLGARRTVLVRWKATNPEHLALTAYIDYSRNRGRTWRTIFAGPNKGRASLQSFFFTASRHGRVRVRINDGFNETDAVSGQFTAAGAPPEVAILTRLARGMHFAGDAHLQLTGQAVDQAAQNLTARRLRWFDGPFLLGTGSAISAGPLPAGVNHIRLVARDPAGRTASATLTVTVSPVNLPFLKLKIPNHVSRHARKLTLRADASIAATLTIGRRSFRLGTKPTNFSLPISRGKTSLLLHLSVSADAITTPFAALITRR